MGMESESQKKAPMISVIVAVYNEEERLDKCISSILQQTYQDFEIVIVNDGSTDGSAEIIDQYVKAYEGKVIGIRKKNGGQAFARNCGINRSKAKYITFLDADDYIDQNYLKVLVSTAEQYKCDMVCSGQHKVRENGEIIHSIIYKSDDGRYLTRRLNISGKIYLASYIKENQIFFPEKKTYEDNSFNLQAFFLTKKISFLGYAGYYQIVHEGSTTSKRIHIDHLPLEEWDNCISKILNRKEKGADIPLFEFTVLSLFTYLLFVRIRKREYLSNTDRKSNVQNALAIAQSFQEMTNKHFPHARKNQYASLVQYKELSFSQKAGVKLFSWMCYLKQLERFTAIFYKLAK